VNYWGHVYLTLLLLDRMVQSKPARIVNMVSQAEALGYFDPDDVTGE
jgi:NAD(P)-dependent dehydrogenase (short-subunit alcohol dehydrogenase family)